jgi:hypothetical protein
MQRAASVAWIFSCAMADTPTQADVEAAFLQNAVAGTQSVEVDGLKVVSMSVEDQLLALDRVASVPASKLNSLGLIFRRLIPPGGGGF